MRLSVVRPFVLCPLSEVEEGRKLLVAELKSIAVRLTTCVEWAEQIDDPERAVDIGYLARDVAGVARKTDGR